MVSDFLAIPYGRIHLYELSTDMIRYTEPPMDGLQGPVRSMCTVASGLAARDIVLRGTPVRTPVTSRYLPHGCSTPVKVTPCCSAVSLNIHSFRWPEEKCNVIARMQQLVLRYQCYKRGGHDKLTLQPLAPLRDRGG